MFHQQSHCDWAFKERAPCIWKPFSIFLRRRLSTFHILALGVLADDINIMNLIWTKGGAYRHVGFESEADIEAAILEIRGNLWDLNSN